MADVHDDGPQTWCQKLYVKSCDILEETAECLASWPIGQTILKQADRCLWTVEKCAEWSLPNTQVPKQNGTKDTFGDNAPLVRPLPWALFLPMLIFLRCMRAGVNVCAILIGVEPVKPGGVVKFIQVRRRRVRALKFMGLRRMRQRKLSQQLAAISAPTWQKRINNMLSGVMCFKAAVHNDISEPIASKDVVEENANSTSTSGQYVKRKYVEILKYDMLWDNIDDDEELMAKIDKLVQEGNGEDPDFMPVEEDSQSEDDSLSECEENATTSTCQAVESQSNRNSVTNESIEEENEESDSTTMNSDEESTQLKTSPTNCKKEQETDAKVNSTDYQAESNITDEFYSPQNSISVTPEPQRDLDEDSGKCNTKSTPEKSPTKSADAQVTENFLQAEKNEVYAKNESDCPNSHQNKHETLVANENSPLANSINNHK